METNEPEIGQDSSFVHFQKINIFGEAGVGKSTLISFMKNYDKLKNEIKTEINRKDSKLSENSDFFKISLIEEKVSSVQLNINGNPLYFNLYETNLDNIDKIQNYLHILLMQTECVLIVWNKNNKNTFKNIPRLISVIEQDIKDNNLRDFPIILLENDIDININDSQIDQFDMDIDENIEKFKKEYNNIFLRKLELTTKENLKYFLLELEQIIQKYENNKSEYIRSNDIVNLIKFNLSSLNQGKAEKQKYKCLLLGHSATGKTTFYNWFRNDNNNFNINLSTVGVDYINLKAEVCGEKISLKLFDTAGQEKFSTIPNLTTRDAQGILLLYDITNDESFKKVSYWINEINEKNEKKPEIILIGNKIDLYEDRVVAKTEATKLAESKNIKYFECSGKLKLNVYEILSKFFILKNLI